MICTKEDHFLYERIMGETIWVATLNDNTIVYQDDYRPGAYPESAWLRLRQHCLDKNKYITNIYFKFRSHLEHIPSHKDGYLFLKGALAGFGGPTLGYYIIGYIDNNKLYVDKYKVPELLKEYSEERNIDDYKDLIITKI